MTGSLPLSRPKPRSLPIREARGRLHRVTIKDKNKTEASRNERGAERLASYRENSSTLPPEIDLELFKQHFELDARATAKRAVGHVLDEASTFLIRQFAVACVADQPRRIPAGRIGVSFHLSVPNSLSKHRRSFIRAR